MSNLATWNKHCTQNAIFQQIKEIQIQITQEYIDKLRTLAETFKKVDEQSARLAHDSEEMSNLNRTLTAINKTYDLHFQSISKQVGTIEQINDETRQLAKRIKELNAVYGRMIEALSVNIPFHIAEDPLHSVAIGAGVALKNIDRFSFLMR